MSEPRGLVTWPDATGLARLVRSSLAVVRTEYPHKLDQELRSDADLRPPRELNPSFYGCYDWHSAVHNHWLLVRALDRGLPADLAAAVVSLLDEHLSPRRLAVETAFFSGQGGVTSERPYGWAWLLMLHAECEAGGAPCRRWADALAPLAALLSERLLAYFGTGLAFPIRSGTHGNTAFSLQLAIAAARRRGDADAEAALIAAARRFFAADTALPWGEQPSGDAFLSAPLAEAALLAEILPAGEFAAWLGRALAEPAAVSWAPPAFTPDGNDPGTVHLEGLLISRTWCLIAIGRALPAGHPVATLANASVAAHLAQVARIDPVAGFNRSHWVPTFLLYLDEQQRAAAQP